ncbi:DUF1289 domain-containing protein [Breoghania sp. L-A4]|uniref:DUF1289 domain-containing protein n=1 Tax=Breoghania sp. L-A4 TaxID=2304600 RepID=UPI000E35961A|nr:DUF1289 domain-containing protein [Breoghania sp. L-A4]AXS40105.1 DUF1289 domain-containing protein [Breoghania sp. L-A4]
MTVSRSSPCIKICVIDQASGLCRGCARTLDEIAAWGGLDDSARQTITDRLPARMAALAGETA